MRRTGGQPRAALENSAHWGTGALIRGVKRLQIDLDGASLLFFPLCSLRVPSKVGPRINKKADDSSSEEYRDR